MATIGLYHMDLWHSVKAVPNLELMKIYNYFIEKGDRVLMIGPQDELARFNYIYFFKDSQQPLGKEASSKLAVDNKKLIGYGFFGSVEKLKPEVFNQKVNYQCYDALFYRLKNKTHYNLMSKNSLVRVETEDFTDYKSDKSIIFLADNNPTGVPQMADFLLEYKNHRFYPLYPFTVNSSNIQTFVRFENLIQENFYCKDYNGDIYKEYCYDRHIAFDFNKRENESENHFITRLLAMGIVIKNHETTPSINIRQFTGTGIAEKVYKWILAKEWTPFITYYSDDKEIQNYIFNAPTEIRLLCKTKPLGINSSTFDLQHYF